VVVSWLDEELSTLGKRILKEAEQASSPEWLFFFLCSLIKFSEQDKKLNRSQYEH
jgi:hypothetical protein